MTKTADLNRYRTVLSLDGLSMTLLAQIGAIYRLKCRTTASHSAMIRRAIELLHAHIAPLIDKDNSDIDVLLEGKAIKDARKMREGLAGWSLDSRTLRAEEGRPPLAIDLEEGDEDGLSS